MLRLLAAASLALACAGTRPTTSTAGLHEPCPASGCEPGQTCVSAPGPSGPTSSCEIACDSDDACPEGLACNLPPVAPDSLPNTCR